MNLVKQSAKLSELFTSLMSDTSEVLDCSGAVVMFSINSLLDLRKPLDMTSKRQLESVNSFGATRRRNRRPTSLLNETAASLISANAITSPAIAERVIQRDLYDLKMIETLLPCSSTSNMMFPSWVDKLRLLAKDESEKATIRTVGASSFGMASGTGWLIAYLTERLGCLRHSQLDVLKWASGI